MKMERTGFRMASLGFTTHHNISEILRKVPLSPLLLSPSHAITYYANCKRGSFISEKTGLLHKKDRVCRVKKAPQMGPPRCNVSFAVDQLELLVPEKMAATIEEQSV
jgi:hypothetical protein